MNNFYTSIQGWLYDSEAQLLYDLAHKCQGPILEIGFFMGRSTSVICDAIRNSNHNNQFDSYDINFKTIDEFMSFYAPIHGANVSVPELVQCIVDSNESPLSITQKNLTMFGLEKYVNLHAGDFSKIESQTYDFIFCDAMHDVNEIRRNAQHLVRLSNEKFVWAIHDVYPDLVSVVLENANRTDIKLISHTNSLAVFANQ
jgi:predicted O-methyltransferase YrrM